MRVRLPLLCLLAAGALALLTPASTLALQSPAIRDSAEREVSKIIFEGNRAFSSRELRNYIATEQTRCKNFFFTPACLLTSASFFENRKYLDYTELARDSVRLRVQYWLRGYRSAAVGTRVRRTGSGEVEVTFAINEGEPLRVAEFNVVGPPDSILPEAKVTRLVTLRAGDPLDLIALDSTRIRLRGALWEQGYSDAIIRTDTTRRDSGMSVTINIEPRWISRVARIQVTGNKKIETTTIENSMFLKVGEPFRLSDVVRSRRALYESGLFKRASVDATDSQDSAKTVIVTVDEATLRQARLGGGLSTVEFFQVDAQFTNFNWMGNARRVTLNLTLGNLLAQQLNGKSIFTSALQGIDTANSAYLDPTWRASAELKLPWWRSPRNELLISAFAQRRSLPGVFVDRSLGFNGVFTREVAERVPVSFGYQYEVTRVDAGDLYFCVNFALCDPPTVAALRSAKAMSPLSVSTTIDKTDDPISSTRGFVLRASVEHASSFTLSDYRYNRALVDAAWFMPLPRDMVLGIHTRAGWVGSLGSTSGALGVDAEGRSILHPRKRFFAGGSQSVRGFGESQLGPRILTIPRQRLVDAGCQIGAESAVCDEAILADRTLLPDSAFTARPLGGNTLVEGSVELRFPLMKNLGAAVFVDGALVGASGLGKLKQSTIAVTPGFGIRYNSMAGPIRVDFGFNPFLAEDLPVVTEITQANSRSRIATLEMLQDGEIVAARRTFTPPRSGGFLGFLTRFTLHLSIGQAF